MIYTIEVEHYSVLNQDGKWYAIEETDNKEWAFIEAAKLSASTGYNRPVRVVNENKEVVKTFRPSGDYNERTIQRTENSNSAPQSEAVLH